MRWLWCKRAEQVVGVHLRSLFGGDVEIVKRLASLLTPDSMFVPAVSHSASVSFTSRLSASGWEKNEIKLVCIVDLTNRLVASRVPHRERGGQSTEVREELGCRHAIQLVMLSQCQNSEVSSLPLRVRMDYNSGDIWPSLSRQVNRCNVELWSGGFMSYRHHHLAKMNT